ncbi:MAG: diguanylate cyclase [Leptospiraceae bacterium]|nr:diguanylate cyclase [Leptospiraceae bacterium]
MDEIQVSENWELAIGKETDLLSDVKNYSFTPFKPIELTEKFNSKTGTIWLRNKFTVPKDKLILFNSIFLEFINPTDETYLNGKLIGMSGKNIYKDGYFFSYWNEARNYFAMNLEESNELYIKIVFNNEISYEGKIVIGIKESLDERKKYKDFYHSIIYIPISFMMFLMGIFYLKVYFKRKGDKDILYYSMMAFLSVLSQINFFIVKIPIDLRYIDYLWLQKITFSASSFFPLAVISYTNFLLREKVYKLESFLIKLFTIVPGLLFLLIPNYYYLREFRKLLFIIVMIIPLAYAIGIVFWKAIKRHNYARTFLLGLLPFALCIIFDLIFHVITTHNEVLYLTFLGMPSFIIALGFIQGNNFIRDRNKIEELNKTLDRKVLERTNELLVAKQEIESAMKELERVARTDSLTGLLNRLNLIKSLENEFLRGLRYKTPFSILLIDLDHFKNINDTYGHLAGDQALRIVGELIGKSFRTVDVVGRYGGEEFCVVLPETKSVEAYNASEKLRLAILKSSFDFNGMTIKLACSIGISEFKNEDANVSEILERADKALYKAKNNGRNQSYILNEVK